MGWKLTEWNDAFSRKAGSKLPPMTESETASNIKYLRDNNYPKPDDCPEQKCPVCLPVCQLKVCRIAVGMCGDF